MGQIRNAIWSSLRSRLTAILGWVWRAGGSPSRAILDEASPVAPGEWLLRGIHEDQYKTSDTAAPVQRGGFVPNSSDFDGLSLFREGFATAEQVAGATGKLDEYYVARIPADAVRQLGLTLTPKKSDTNIPGHIVIPEITCVTHKDKETKKRTKELELALTELANKPGAIVRVPPPHS